MAFSEEFSDQLLAEQANLPLKEVPENFSQKSVSTIWSKFGQSLEIQDSSNKENRENMSTPLNVKKNGSEEGQDSQENGHGEGTQISEVTSVPESDDEEIGNSQVVSLG